MFYIAIAIFYARLYNWHCYHRIHLHYSFSEWSYEWTDEINSWWHHGMKMLSTLLALCMGYSLVMFNKQVACDLIHHGSHVMSLYCEVQLTCGQNDKFTHCKNIGWDKMNKICPQDAFTLNTWLWHREVTIWAPHWCRGRTRKAIDLTMVAVICQKLHARGPCNCSKVCIAGTQRGVFLISGDHTVIWWNP